MGKPGGVFTSSNTQHGGQETAIRPRRAVWYAGAFTLGAIVHCFHIKKLEPLVRPAIVTGFLGYSLVCVGLLLLPGAGPVLGMQPLDLLFGAAVIFAGAPVFIKGLRSLIFARRITIDLLMVIASAGALAIGATGEAVTVILLFMLGEALEAYSAERARDSLRTLMALQRFDKYRIARTNIQLLPQMTR